MASAAKQLLVKLPMQISARTRPCRIRGTSMAVEYSGLYARQFLKLTLSSNHLTLPAPARSSADNGAVSSVVDDDDGVSLGTMKLPLDTDLPRFEILLFQWANSLCQGASLPLPLPLKIDKIKGGVRLGFVTIENGESRVLAHIDCVVSPATGTSGPVFSAVRNGTRRDQVPPGEPRIMKSLLSALQKSVEIARV